jgi:hypothetical protein
VCLWTFGNHPSTAGGQLLPYNRTCFAYSLKGLAESAEARLAAVAVGDKSVGSSPVVLQTVLSGVDSPAVCSQQRCDLTALTVARTPAHLQHACCAMHANVDDANSFLDVFPASGQVLLHGDTGWCSV